MQVDSLVVLIWALVPVVAYAVGLVAVRRHAPGHDVVRDDPATRLEQLRPARAQRAARTGRPAEARRLAESGALTGAARR